MSEFLNTNGPWDLLVEAGHIALRPLVAGTSVVLSSELSVTPFLVPHRDEYSETVGYRIDGPSQTVLFIPDIDKWSRWETSLQEAVAGCDLALIDGTFYDGAEVGHRDLSLIPHPFVIESLEIMEDWPRGEREKVQFIHLNHTNPLLAPQSEAADSLRATGASIARFGAIFAL
jgi:pyrroloquinoline quinone biosynthesis protein B